jgi:hypothetical protein
LLWILVRRVNNHSASQMPRLRTDITSVVAGVFALASFTVALLAGLLGGNDMAVILVRAIIAMVVCYPVGMMAGALLSKVIEDGLRDHAIANPIPVEHAEQAADTVDKGKPAEDEEVIEV